MGVLTLYIKYTNYITLKQPSVNVKLTLKFQNIDYQYIENNHL